MARTSVVGFSDHLRNYARDQGADRMTCADLTIQGLLLREENRDGLLGEGFHRALSLALRISESACELVLHPGDQGLMHYFRAHCLGQAERLDWIAQRIALFLEEHGYRAFVVPGLGTGYTCGHPGVLSHMAVANVSGMGTMGDGGMLLVPEYGPRVRLATIVTDCPLPPGAPLMDLCTHCGLCSEICPSKAIQGKRFSPDHPTLDYIDRNACKAYRDGLLAATGNRFCNLCMAVCPVGMRLPRKGDKDRVNHAYKGGIPGGVS